MILNKRLGSREVAESCKHEKKNLISQIHERSRTWQCVPTIPGLANWGQRQMDPWGAKLVSLCSQRPCLQTINKLRAIEEDSQC